MSGRLAAKSGGEAIFIKTDKDGNIIGDHVVAKGFSIFCKKGSLKAGDPIVADYLPGGAAELKMLRDAGKVVMK